MQEMMKAMMQGQGGDQFDMEEMQSQSFFLIDYRMLICRSSPQG